MKKKGLAEFQGNPSTTEESRPEGSTGAPLSNFRTEEKDGRTIENTVPTVQNRKHIVSTGKHTRRY